MKGLGTILSLLEQRLKEKQSEMVLLDKEVTDIQEQITHHQKTIEHEIACSTHLPEFQEGLVVFLDGMNYKFFYLNVKLKQAISKQELCRNDLREIFSEMKRYEIAKEKMEKRIIEQRKHQEMIDQNDLTLTRFVWCKKTNSSEPGLG